MLRQGDLGAPDGQADLAGTQRAQDRELGGAERVGTNGLLIPPLPSETDTVVTFPVQLHLRRQED